MFTQSRFSCRYTARWAALLTAASAVTALAQSPIPYHMQPCTITIGMPDAPIADEIMVYSQTVGEPGAPWLRLTFGAFELDPASEVRITSLLDGASQRFEATSLETWQKTSAFFNGDEVLVELFVAPNATDDFITVVEMMVGDWIGQAGSPDSLCGPDDRVASNEPRVGRLVPSGCTGWIVSNGAHLTAGHCIGAVLDTFQFNIPPSQCDGTIVNPPPQDQYPMGAVTTWNQPGNDWAVFACGTNANTGLLPVQAQGAFYRMSRDDTTSVVRVTGCGTDNTPPGCMGGANAQNQTLQTDSGPFLGETVAGANEVYLSYQVDTMPASSGSPIILQNSTMTVGVHTNGGCDPPNNQGNWGTGFENNLLEAALQQFPGATVRYVDNGHFGTTEDGTVFRPWNTVAQGVGSVPAGGILSVVAGNYAPAIAISKAMRIEAPVGLVRIGQ